MVYVTMKPKSKTTDEVSEKQFDLVLEEDHGFLHPKVRKPLKKIKKRGWRFISLAGELGFDIALPMVGGLVLGKFFDERWNSHPKATLVFLGVGFVIACASLIRIVLDVIKKR